MVRRNSLRTDKARMTLRRAKVASMILGGYRSIRGIAKKMGVSPATACRDVKAIEKEWAGEVDTADRERHRVRELKKLDQMEGAVTIASLGYVEGEGEGQTRNIDLAMEAQKSRIALMKRRARLLGLDTENINLRNITSNDVLQAMIILEEEEAKEDKGLERDD